MDMAADRKDGAAAVLLQLVSHTAMMEGMLRQQNKDLQDVAKPRHISLVTKNRPVIRTKGPVIRREEMLQSVSVMLRNSDLAAIPGGGEAAAALASISGIAEAGEGPLTPDELVAIAGQYGATHRQSCSACSRRSLWRSRTKAGRPWAGHARRCHQFSS